MNTKQHVNGEPKHLYLAHSISFSSREKEILQLISLGYSRKEIGGLMHLSFHTINDYLKSLFRKSGCRNAAEMTRFGFETGLLERRNHHSTDISLATF